MMVGRATRWLAVLSVLLVPLTACASIPEESDPVAVREADERNTTTEVTPPPDNLDPLGLVRRFVDSASPASNHEAARMHLDDLQAKQWSPGPDLLIVDNVDTIPAPPPEPLPEGVQLVTVQADRVGRLLKDSSFVPDVGEYETTVRVELQPDGKWRIASPPAEMVVSRDAFSSVYRSVPIYFLDHDSTGVVPDLRYVASQPASTLPRRVIDLLTAGPSERMQSALRTAIPPGVHPRTNTSEATGDGALEVNLSKLGEVSDEKRWLIAAQVVFTLQKVSNARVRLQEEGLPLLATEQDLWPTDLARYEIDNMPRQDLGGLAVIDERIKRLDSRADPIPGPAGSGEYQVLRAGQSPDGRKIAAVTRRSPDEVVLRVGPYGESLHELGALGSFMSKPTWRGNDEVWTVIGGRDVIRARSGESGWTVQRVDSAQFAGGRQITDLRLSRDGTRAAAVIDGKLVVSAVADRDGAVVLERPTTLPNPQGAQILGLEWRDKESLAVITDSNGFPVYDVSVDGFRWRAYTSANLGQPMKTITVGPGPTVIVADRSSIWSSPEPGDVWSLLEPRIGSSSLPFFPG
ncbi:Sporulation and spore germination [Saccharopolyspora antimicrobica]|uniref:Sporulation and spore germination n=1 Tax=Saccharopolyspora antimicrobica TaxID=455193 RepID=A0A1I5LDL2_9PSEU|nr:LpqB family beta-propeller domain-containing protein [Saccharopolyspora antimicrobica]RKT85456.1 sporulation and spore germination protein [Saccharopolyspora antimicrobica]SFO95275.1 Sporulation and spore germination [Saccharopolyspora antimicrobica]